MPPVAGVVTWRAIGHVYRQALRLTGEVVGEETP